MVNGEWSNVNGECVMVKRDPKVIGSLIFHHSPFTTRWVPSHEAKHHFILNIAPVETRLIT